MMDQAWSRHWAQSHSAARQARAARKADAARMGKPVPTLWGDIRALVRDLIRPPVRQQADNPCDPAASQSSL